MRSNRSRDTAPELRLRSLLHRAGLRYKTHARPEPSLRCEADIVFPKSRTVVFIDGCFWHGCPKHATFPATNRDWWAEKLAANRARDRRNRGALRSAGWKVIRAWTHERAEHAARRIESVVRDQSATSIPGCAR